MSSFMLFAGGLAATLLVSLAVVAYLNRPLGKLLEELCGNRERAEFWRVFSSVTLGLVPLIFAMQYLPEPGPRALVEVSIQFKWGLIGLLASILGLGWVVGRFIRKSPAPASGVRSEPKFGGKPCGDAPGEVRRL